MNKSRNFTLVPPQEPFSPEGRKQKKKSHDREGVNAVCSKNGKEHVYSKMNSYTKTGQHEIKGKRKFDYPK